MIGLCLFLPYSVPPLTLDTVFAVVKTMRSWRKLGEELMGKEKLDSIQYQHVSDEACLKTVVEAFLLGEGIYQPSWRRLIHQLHKVEESHLAEKIKTNAEPHQGKWVCIIPPQCMHNTSHMTSISNPVFFPSAIYAHCLTLLMSMTKMIKPQGVLLINLLLP